jgi:hypothetical protein
MEAESSLPCSQEFATFCNFSQMKRVRAAPLCLRSVLILSSNLCPMSFKWFLHVSLPKLCAFVSHTYHLLRPSDASSFQSYYTVTIILTPVHEPQISQMWFILCCVCWQSCCLAWKLKRNVWFIRRTTRNTLLAFPSYVLPSTSPAWTPLHAVREPILIHDVVRQVTRNNFSELLRAKLTQSFRPHYGAGIDSASNRNEYLEYFLGVKAAGA